MKVLTRKIHSWTRALRLENAVISASKVLPSFIKFLPLPEEYDRTQTLTIRRAGANFIVNPSDYMQWHLYADLPDLSWQKALEVLPAQSVVLDVGANCGQFSLKLAAALHGRKSEFVIHSFEPNPFICSRLRENVAINELFRNQIVVHELGLGDREGIMAFNYNPANSGGGSFSAGGEGPHKIPIACLDQVVESLQLRRVDFIKIDVEGFEPEVLTGSKQVLKMFRPWLYLEITPAWFQSRGHSVDALIAFLQDLGYSMLGESGSSFIPFLKNEQLFRSLHQFNMLVQPPDRGVQ